MPWVFCGACSAMISPKVAVNGLCPECNQKYSTPDERENAIISRAEKGNKAAISWLQQVILILK